MSPPAADTLTTTDGRRICDRCSDPLDPDDPHTECEDHE